jgi:hypothetical protein
LRSCHVSYLKMMIVKQLNIALLVLFLFGSCGVFQKTAKQELTDGFYTERTKNTKEKVYVDVADDNILIYPTLPEQSGRVDTSAVHRSFDLTHKSAYISDFKLEQASFDLDFLTIPVKYRFSTINVPPQLNAGLNGSVYLGFRKDIYQIAYASNPLKVPSRRIIHFGYSFGLFTGIGNAFMSPTTTSDQIQQEYDGIVWSKGVAGIFAVNNFTVGLALGFDYLLDKNKSVWIYQNKPWIGIALGLNLN